jgi:hypothetical protein
VFELGYLRLVVGAWVSELGCSTTKLKQPNSNTQAQTTKLEQPISNN